MYKKYNIISPDGFAISFEDFRSMKKANEYYHEWKKRFEFQGYYSSPTHGHIPLNVLDSYCRPLIY